MESISPSELALELVNRCLRGGDWPEDLLESLLGQATAADPDRELEASRALFGILVERLADLFEPALCETYATLFARAIKIAQPELRDFDLAGRYQRVRRARRFEGDSGAVKRVFVLSRVTLGADVAVTSVVLDGMKRRFPVAAIFLAGPRKAWEMFEADPRVGHLPITYGRGATLRERLAVWPALKAALADTSTIVVDPDSRLTQLGLLPVCPEQNYYFFESRSYGGDGEEPLPRLAARWVEETFGVAGARPYVALPAAPVDDGRPLITISLGVGENPAKRIPDPFEENLLRGLVRDGALLLADTGAGGEEAERVARAVAASGAPPHQIRIWRGAFAPFAAAIARSRLYVGYDSAGQHVAAACGVPLVSVFAGFASPRMFARWRPTGAGPIEVIRVNDPDPERTLVQTLAAAYRFWNR